MAVRVVNLKNDDLTKILLTGISKPIENAKPFFNMLTTTIFKQTMSTFRQLGRRAGNSKWSKYSQKTLHPSYNGKIKTRKWNKRPGTDGNKTRRYTTSSRLLQASGSFRNSFTIIKADKKSGTVGTKMALAKKIMSNPDRPVLFVNPSDYRVYTSMFKQYVDGGIKF